MFVPSLGLTLRARRGGSALRLSSRSSRLRRQDAGANIADSNGPKGESQDRLDSFVTAQAEPVPDLVRDCRSEHRQRRWPEGRRAERPESTLEVSSTPLSPPDTKKAPCGALFVSGGERGIRTLDRAFDPIHP